MRILKENKVLFCDVEDTLVIYNYPYSAEGLVLIEHPLTKKEIELLPNKHNISLLHKFSKQGFFIIVWSLGGWYWTEAVVGALGLKKVVNLVMSKPAFHIDDSNRIEDILGENLFRGRV